MSDTRVSSHRLCPHCGAPIDPGAERCFLCLTKPGPAPASQPAPTEAASPNIELQQLNFATTIGILALIGLLSVGLILLATAVPYAIGFMILLVLVVPPVLIRFWKSPHGRGGTGVVAGAKGIAAILGIIVAGGVAGFAAFFVTCFGVFFAGTAVASGGGWEPVSWGMLAGFVVGPICGIAVAVALGRALFRS